MASVPSCARGPEVAAAVASLYTEVWRQKNAVTVLVTFLSLKEILLETPPATSSSHFIGQNCMTCPDLHHRGLAKGMRSVCWVWVRLALSCGAEEGFLLQGRGWPPWTGRTHQASDKEEAGEACGGGNSSVRLKQGFANCLRQIILQKCRKRSAWTK